MQILIENMQNKIDVDENIENLIKKAIEISFQQEKFETPSEINVMLVDNQYIREVNLEHRNIDKSTDVLSFPLADIQDGTLRSDTGDYDLNENLLILGDILISMDKTKEQAENFQHSFLRELIFLVTHGTFHLLGYDHQNEQQESTMIGKQESVLRKMGLERGN